LQSKVPLSSPSRDELVAWRLYLESSQALVDLLDADLQQASGISLRWYDVLVHLEEAPECRLRMSELARSIVASTSGLTRVVDGMEQAGLVRRERPPTDRRAIEVVPTPKGIDVLNAARPLHRHAIQQHFSQHLTAQDVRALTRALTKVRDHVRPLREQQIGGTQPQPPSGLGLPPEDA
jgi:DNA-binding MarR family transcriptional regulator